MIPNFKCLLISKDQILDPHSIIQMSVFQISTELSVFQKPRDKPVDVSTFDGPATFDGDALLKDLCRS